MGGQIDERLLFWQTAISIILYFALYIVEMQIKYDDDDDVTSS